MFAFDAHRLVESMCRVWANLYDTVATYREEVFFDEVMLEQEVNKLSGGEEGRVKKMTGELYVCRQQLRTFKDSLMEQGTTITQL